MVFRVKGSIKTNVIVGNVHRLGQIVPIQPSPSITTHRTGTPAHGVPTHLPGFPGGAIPSGQPTQQGFGMGLLDEMIMALASLGLIVPLMDTFTSVEHNIYTPTPPSTASPVTYANGSFYILLPNNQVATLPAKIVEQLVYYIEKNPSMLKQFEGNKP